MLLAQRLVRVFAEHQALEEGPVQIVSVAFLNSELVILDFGSQLSEKWVTSTLGNFARTT